MNAYTVLSMVLPSAFASCAAAAGLALSSGAPARWRLAIASAGLLAWVIPWPAIVLPMLSPQAAAGAGYIANDFPTRGYFPATDGVLLPPQGSATSTGLPLAVLELVALAGLAMLVVDVVRYQRTVARWRRDSVSGEHLRTLLAPSMRAVPWAIRILPRSRTAAATGLVRGTIWIGDDLTRHAHLKAALLHESVHIHRRDAIAIAIVTVIKRLYFWNPVVRYFAARAELFIEAACDEECAQLLGREGYRQSLAKLILDSQGAPLAFGSSVKSGRHDVLRVAALGAIPKVDWRACLGAALGAVGLAAAATLNAQDSADPRIGSWDEVRGASNYESLLRVFEKLDNGMIRMQVNAKLREENRVHVDFKCDGKPYRMLTQAGVFTGMTTSCTRTGARTVETLLIRGQLDAGVAAHQRPEDLGWSKGTETVSADGEHYSFVFVGQTVGGKARESRREFVRRHVPSGH